MRIDATLAGQIKIEVGIDGATGWQKSPDGLAEIPADQMGAVEFERWREPELILLRHKEPGTVVTPRPDAAIDGKPQFVIALAQAAASIQVTMYIDKATKLVTRMTYSEGGAATVDDFSDYKPIGGIQIAHRRKSAGGGRTTDLSVATVEIDPTVEPALFKKPAP